MPKSKTEKSLLLAGQEERQKTFNKTYKKLSFLRTDLRVIPAVMHEYIPVNKEGESTLTIYQADTAKVRFKLIAEKLLKVNVVLESLKNTPQFSEITLTQLQAYVIQVQTELKKAMPDVAEKQIEKEAKKEIKAEKNEAKEAAKRAKEDAKAAKKGTKEVASSSQPSFNY